MRSLSDLFKWVGYAVLAIAIVVGIYMAVQAESFLVCLYYVVGGGVACMLLLAYGYILDVAADLKDRLNAAPEAPKVAVPPIQDNPVQAATANAASPEAQDRHPEYKPTNCAFHLPDVSYIVCPKCGFEQVNNRPNCFRCGAKLPNDI